MEIILFLSVATNIALSITCLHLRKNPKKQESYEVIDLLHDLTAGKALIKVERVSPADVFLRSPRGQ